MRSSLVRFLVIVAALLAYTAWKIAELWPEEPVGAVAAACCVFALILGSQLTYRLKPAVYEQHWFAILAWSGTLLMGLWATFLLISIPFDLVKLIFPFDDHVPHFQWGILVVALLVSALGFLQVLRGPRVVHATVGKSNLPQGLQELKIAQISDLHIGPTIRSRYVRRVVERTNALSPDVIVITGDLTDGDPHTIEKHLNELKGLKSRCGVFYVTGNHEYYWNAGALLPLLPPLGLTVLLNENRILNIDGAKLMIAGVTDPMGGQVLRDHHPDYKKAAASTEKCDFQDFTGASSWCLQSRRLFGL